MSLERLLPEFLQREEEETVHEGAVLHECRHCGSKFDEQLASCPVCGATEIATYEFGGADSDDVDAAADDESDGDEPADENSDGDDETAIDA